MRSADRVVVAWCDPGEVDGRFCFDLLHLVRQRADRLWPSPLRIQGGGLLSRTRNMLVATFLDSTDADWLMMIDSDHQVPVSAFDALVAAAHDRSAPVVSGLYFAAYSRGGPYPMPVPTAYMSGDDGLAPLTAIEPRGLRQVDAVGTGCLLIHRSVLTAMRDDAQPGHEDWCWFADGPTGDGRWLSEDLTFCARLRSRGVPIHVHTGAVFPHHKTFWQTDATYALWRTDE